MRCKRDKTEITIIDWGLGEWLLQIQLPGMVCAKSAGIYPSKRRAMNAAERLRALFIDPPEIEVVD